MKRYDNQPVQISVTPVEGPYLDTAYYLDREPVEITVGMGEHWTTLACKEVYGRGVKTALERHGDSCVFDLSPAALLGQAGLFAALEGIYGGAYRQRFALSGDCRPQLTCYATGQGWSDGALERAVTLAEHILRVRNLVNRPANLLTPALFAAALEKMAAGLPVQAQVYRRQELEELGLHALLAVGTGSGNDPCLAVLRYTGAPGSGERLGLVGKGVTCDDNISKVSIVGAGMQTNPGVASKMFEALAEANINIQMISTSEIKISVLVALDDSDKAVNAIHDAFDL